MTKQSELEQKKAEEKPKFEWTGKPGAESRKDSAMAAVQMQKRKVGCYQTRFIFSRAKLQGKRNLWPCRFFVYYPLANKI